ncbi:TPA: class I SAM-dependent methyltransferase [Candidatus Ventrenecus avicola]|nr:class I SAM-dependent methyltransferase [Candidatus Ventrenecus avicola]
MEHYFTNNSHLKSEIRTISYENKGVVFTFFSDLGVFSKDKIDYGSRVLVETIIHQGKKYNNILDVGCGYGFIGIVLGKLNEASVVFTDVNKRALHLCERNIKENKIKGEIVLSNAYENITETYDLIVTNPPIRAGKEVVLNIIRDARKHLKEDGELWFVIRKDQGVKSIIKCVEDIYKTEVVKKDKGFYIVRAKIY